MRKTGGRWAIRDNHGVIELVWIDVVRNGFWRGIRVEDGVPTRGPIEALLGRFGDKGDAISALSAATGGAA